MSDIDEIRNTLARFCQHLDGRRFEEWTQTFTQDGVFNQLEGRAAILKMIQGGELATKPELTRRHTIVNAIIEVHGERAEAVSDLIMYDKLGDGPWTIRVGRYFDDLVRQPNGTWLFQKRRLEFYG